MRMGNSLNQLRFRFFLLSLLFIFFLNTMVAAASSQTIEIVLLNGKKGQPMVGKYSWVNVWMGTSRKKATVVNTDKNGVAQIQLTSDPSEENIPQQKDDAVSVVVQHPVFEYDERLSFNAPYVICGSGGSNYSWLGIMNFSTSEILQRGFVSPNTCGKATASPEPGKLVLFVRKLSWWEAFKN